MTEPVSGWRISSAQLKTIVGSLGERIDSAALDPGQWGGFVEGLQAILPNLRVAIEGRDDALPLPLAMATRGWSERETMDYVNYYSAVSPWVTEWQGLTALVPHLSDASVPLRELQKTEFYHDWLRPIRDAEHGTGMKLLDSGGRTAVVHVHYGSHRMEEQHAILSSVMSRLALRMRGALLSNRVLALRSAPRAKGSIMDSLIDPAFLLDHACRLISANAAADALLQEEGPLWVGAHDAFRLRSETQHQAFAVAVETVCRFGTSEGGHDLVLSDGVAQWTLSLLPVAQNAAQDVLDRPLGLFLPRALALVVLRRVGQSGVAPPSRGILSMPQGLTPAEQRLVEALCEGGTLPGIASRLGIAYETARAHLKRIYAKTGTHSQRELLTLLIKG